MGIPIQNALKTRKLSKLARNLYLLRICVNLTAFTRNESDRSSGRILFKMVQIEVGETLFNTF